MNGASSLILHLTQSLTFGDWAKLIGSFAVLSAASAWIGRHWHWFTGTKTYLITFEPNGFIRQDDGSYMHVVGTVGKHFNVSDVFVEKILAGKVQKAAKKAKRHGGFVELRGEENAQRIFMEALEDFILTNDWGASLDLMHGRPTKFEPIIMAPMFFRDWGKGETIIRVQMFGPEWLEKCKDPKFVASTHPKLKRHGKRKEIVKAIVDEYYGPEKDRNNGIAKKQQSGDTATVWVVDELLSAKAA